MEVDRPRRAVHCWFLLVVLLLCGQLFVDAEGDRKGFRAGHPEYDAMRGMFKAWESPGSVARSSNNCVHAQTHCDYQTREM